MKRPASILYGGPDDESFSAHSALDYLAEQWALDQLRVGVEVEVAKYRRKPFELERFESAIASAWDGILTELEADYATDDSIGLEDVEEEFTAAAGKLLLKLARESAVPMQCELVEIQTWWWSGKAWKLSRARVPALFAREAKARGAA